MPKAKNTKSARTATDFEGALTALVKRVAPGRVVLFESQPILDQGVGFAIEVHSRLRTRSMGNCNCR